LGLRNPWFMAIPAMLYIMLFAASSDPDAAGFEAILLHQLRAAPLAIIVTVAALASAFYIVPKRVAVWPSRIMRGIAGSAQTACHVVALAALASAYASCFDPPSGWLLVPAGLLIGAVGGVVGSIIFAAFLFLLFTLLG